MCHLLFAVRNGPQSYEWNILTGKVSTEYILVKKFNEPRFVLLEYEHS